MDPRLCELDPRPAPLHGALQAARERMRHVSMDLLAIPDAALDREWGWIGEGETDVRSGFYLAIQALEEAAGRTHRTLAQAGVGPGASTPALAAATLARWEVHGLLASLDDAILDADPGHGQWTVRRTLAHVVHVQRTYPWVSAWWLTRPDAVDYPSKVEGLPDEEDDGLGSPPLIRARLDAVVDIGTEMWQAATDDDLAARARWSSFPVTIGFRLGRWAPHISEHTLQIDKTLTWLEEPPTEVHRLVRLVYRSFGRLESAVWGLGTGALDAAAADDPADTVAAAVERATEEAARIASELRSLHA